ncbi:lachesin-like isoform X1 [Danaus plexippus]|uniref:Uncharacterized protein n=1 Tax=Danaus plexippus plexippus TaxID=278856 RepID=A0A212F4T6_DANPL|nr:lachesin-like isoform X1 [Danaus plexippus]OWR48733.1 hypothetical protein KGM_210000 [Danaus plexippus plexippus]
MTGRRGPFRSFAISIIQIITIICQVLTEEPRFAEPIPNVTVALGRDASLPCVVEHLGTYKVAWIHIDRQMILTIHRHVITRLARFSVSHDNAMTWLLHVSQVQQEDRGYYMCQVNTNPMISQVGYLQVVVPPNILDEESTQSAVAVRENQNISLICKADGFPTPKIMWRREDGQPISVDRRKKVTVYEGDTLSLQRISRTEMGAYLCIATNAVPPSVSKRIIVDVEFSPMIWVPNQLVGAPAGTDVTVDCHTEAHPRAISYWVYDSVMVLPTKKYAINTEENSYRAHMKLTVRNLQNGDFGNYRCISKNSLGETEGSIRLYEIPMPSTSPKATEMKSNANKEIVRRMNVTRAGSHESVTERPSVVRAQLDRAPDRGHVYRAPHPHQASGTRSLLCWRQSFLAVMILANMDIISEFLMLCF